MTDGLVLTRRVSERGVHETAQRAGGAGSRAMVRHYVGYEEWEGSGFLRRELARHGVAIVLGFGDSMEVFADEADGSPPSPPRWPGCAGSSRPRRAGSGWSR